MNIAYGSLTALLLVVLYYDVQDLLKLFRRSRQRHTGARVEATALSATRRVDIVIPIYNMGATLARTLASVAASPYPQKRVIVVDDGSDDQSTAQVLADLTPQIDQLDRIPHSGKSAAANHGADLGDGDVILFLDADSYVTANFIHAALAELDRGYAAVDFVQQVANPEESFWSRQAAFEREILTLIPDNFGALFAIRRDAFAQTRFKDCLSPQFEINQRLLKTGQVLISPQKVVYSDEPTTLRNVYRRKRRWVYGMLEGCRIHNLPLDYHILLPYADVLLFAAIIFAIFDIRIAIFPVLLASAWVLKNLLLAKLLGLPPRRAPPYVLYMGVVSVAAVEASWRFLRGKKVAWR